MKAFLLVVGSSLLVWPVFAQTVCNDPEIKSTFTRAQNPKEYHYYLTETKVCSGTQNPNCNQTNVFLALLRNVSLAAPTDAQTPVMNCGVYDVKYPDLPVVGLGGPIRIAINYQDHSITNHTKSGHSFHPGKVVRKIVQHGSDIYIQSEGSGIGGYKTINDTDGLMAFFWGRRDQRLVEAFEKSPVVEPQNSASEDFDTFVQKFSKDRNFQLSRVKFPFKSEIVADYDEKPEVKFISQNQWKHTDFNKPVNFSNDGKSINSPWQKRPYKGKTAYTERLVACGCDSCECGLYTESHFRLIGGKWFFVKTANVFL